MREARRIIAIQMLPKAYDEMKISHGAVLAIHCLKSLALSQAG